MGRRGSKGQQDVPGDKGTTGRPGTKGQLLELEIVFTFVFHFVIVVISVKYGTIIITILLDHGYHAG